VLLDTEPLYTQATQEVVGAFGKTYDWELKRRVMGRGQQEAAELVASELALPIAVAEYRTRVEAALARLFVSTPVMEGAADSVGEIAAAGVPIAIATSTEQVLYALKAQPHDWLAQATVVVCGDDPQVRAPKPAPDIFLVAARRLGVPNDHCVVVEDSPNGVLAAKRAGMQVIALPDPRLDLELVSQAEVVARHHGDVRAALAAVLQPAQ
jgi:pseudouridine-5'-monophosphatase